MKLPDHLPILDRAKRASVGPVYVERELTAPVDLCDAREWRKPWRVVAPHSGAIDLVLEPLVAHTPRLDLGLLATGGVCAFGRWRGRVRTEAGDSAVDGLVGWAEEFTHRW